MLDALKSLFENNVISEEIRADIEASWNAKIQENREAATQQLREEFAQKYEHDKQTIIEAIDTMITDRLTAEIQEFTEDRAQLAEAKAKYAVAIREHSSKLNSFIAEQLAKEISELHEDQKVMAENFAKLEEFVVERDGRISNVKVLVPVYPDLDAEAVRVITASPKWNPGKQMGKAVRVFYQIPIRFTLN